MITEVYNPVILAYIIGKNSEQKEQLIYTLTNIVNVLP